MPRGRLHAASPRGAPGAAADVMPRAFETALAGPRDRPAIHSRFDLFSLFYTKSSMQERPAVGAHPLDVGELYRKTVKCDLHVRYRSNTLLVHTSSPYMIGANGSVRGKKEFEPSSLAAESEPLLGPHLASER